MIRFVLPILCVLTVHAVPRPDHLDDSPFFPIDYPDATPGPTEAPSECENFMYSKGMKSNYGMAIAHRLHSLTVEDISYYFGVTVPVDNGIPTVNLDMRPNAARVLPNAPLATYDDSFSSIGLKHLDKILRHMDDKKYSIINYHTLEKVAHTFHMSELWTRASYYYDLLKNTPVGDDMCGCITDITNNDILPEIELLALKIKFPGITSGAAPGKPGDGAWPINYAYNQPHNDNSNEYRRVLRDFDFSGPEEDVFERAAEELDDHDEGECDHLDNEHAWAKWRQGFKNMNDFDNYQFAVYMHCKLRDF